MKYIIIVLLSFCGIRAASQTKANISVPDSTKKIVLAEAACGQCMFHLKGKGCSLAVRIGGKAYFVDSADIDSFGDPHEKNGFCKAISKAEVQGEVLNNRFKATYFKIIR